MPIIAGMNDTPASNSVDPKVKRGLPVGHVDPDRGDQQADQQRDRPRAPRTCPRYAATAEVRPRQASQKYSTEEKCDREARQLGRANNHQQDHAG